MNKKINAFLNGAGFYIVLFLAIAAIGASGYFIYTTLSGSKTETKTPEAQTVLSEQPEHEVPDVEVHEDVPAASTGDEVQTIAVAKTTEIPAEVETVDTTTACPLKGEVATPYSMDKPIYSETMGDWRTHSGVDIAAEEGATVVAAAAGSITSIVDDYWMGTTVTVACADGVEMQYSSLQASPAVKVGDKVSAGDAIGLVGSTALLEESVGVHLHFAVTHGGAAVDPTSYLEGQ
jgi:murein DD-endopeptidase MepM/ murein hydrolase activator NlpD